MRCPRALTKEGFEKQLGVNHLGHFFLTLQLLDAIKAAAPSRIVNLSSVAHLRGQIKFNDLNSEQNYDPAEAYNQSKLANTLFTRELARKLEGTGVSTFAVHPGIVNTEINRHMGIASSFVATVFVRPILWLFTKSPRQGAQTVIHCALAEGLEADSGAYFSNEEARPVPMDARHACATASNEPSRRKEDGRRQRARAVRQLQKGPRGSNHVMLSRKVLRNYGH